MTHYEKALQLQSDHAEAHWNRSLLWLLYGDFERGWPEYEWRWRREGFAFRNLPQPRWQGTPLAGHSILLYAEQGLGDTVQFVRYASLVKQGGGRVIVECQPELFQLLKTCEGIDELIARPGALPAFDFQIPLVSLPMIFKTTQGSVPAPVPYLRANPEREAFWRNELGSLVGFKIGIAWRGSPGNPGDRQRGIPLACFEPLAAVPGIKLISLQKNQGLEELAALGGKLGIIDLGARTAEDFFDTAAAIKNLDLVICCDTAIAHVAGALGVPVWVAVAKVPDWRWLLHGEQTAWYPTMRLFRQTEAGNWPEVFTRIATCLPRP